MLLGWLPLLCNPKDLEYIINISTFAAFEPDPTFLTSVIFRSALDAFTKLFADEYASKNIRMNNILPGFINSKGLPEKEEVKSRIPLNRYGTTEEIASLVSFLASDGAAIYYRSRYSCGWRHYQICLK